MIRISVSFLQWLEATSWAAAIRRSSWLYPGLEIIHITGIAILVGAAFMFDLRLLGFAKHLPIGGLGDHLLSWSKRGLLLIIPSGVLLFITNAATLGSDPVFWIKMGLLVLAGLNATIFHRFTFQTSGDWKENESLPSGAKAAAVFSIVLWIAIIACGRLLAY